MKRMNDQTNSFADLHELGRRVAESFAPLARLQAQIDAQIPRQPAWLTELQANNQRVAQQIAPVAEQIAAAAKNAEEIRREFARAAAPFRTFTENIARIEGECRLLEHAGWMPHYTTPFELLRQDWTDPAALGSAIEAHYDEHWPAVREQFEACLQRYAVDAEARATFSEALSMHEHGFYRATVCTLFPELERVSRVEIHNGALSGITSQKSLRELAGALMVTDTEPKGYYGLQLYRKLDEHLYEHVRDGAALARIALDHVPNRHAAMHGLVSVPKT